MAFSLGDSVVSTASIFQVLVAFPPAFYYGKIACEQLFYSSRIRIYEFIRAFFLGLISAAIVFVAIVQRYPQNTRVTVYYFDLLKSALGTAFWIWLVADAIFEYRENRTERIVKTVVSGIILPIAFYPTLLYAYSRRNVQDEPSVREDDDPERRPLLREEA